MMPPPESRSERPSTYVVQDLSSLEELQRLQFQEQLLSITLGGLLPEQADPIPFQRVLDMACGTGGWLIELAKAYPGLTQLVGVDISKRMLDTARAAAEAQQVQDRVEFRIMDALSLFELPNDTFDLVNLRFATSFLRTWEWSRVVRELQRVTRPGGVIRLTESDLPDHSSSPALLRLFELLAQAYSRAGKYFQPQARGVSDELAGLLGRLGIQDVQTRLYLLEVRTETVPGQLFFEDMKYLFRTNAPFLRKWTGVPDNYDDLYEQMLAEVQQSDCVTGNKTITAWGHKA